MQLRQPYLILDQIATTASLNEKKAILAAQVGLNHKDFFSGLWLAVDPQIKFYVKQVPKKDKPDGPGLVMAAFEALVNDLTSRKVTGHAALKAIQEAMDEATVAEWNGWYRRILQKDLRAGFGLDLLNAAVGESTYAVDHFECMLAKDSKDRLAKVLTGVKAVEIKYDGVRNLAFYTPNKPVVCISRNGKIFKNFKRVEQSLAEILKGQKEPLVLDGEIVSATFNSLMTQVQRKENANADDAIYVVFDILPASEFKAGQSKLDWEGRRRMLSSIVGQHVKNYDNVTTTSPVYIDFAKEMPEYEDLKRRVLEAGYEGLIIKDPKSVYDCKRSAAWSKVKPFIDVTLTIMDVYPGEPGTKYEAVMGGLTCKGVDTGKEIEVNVGSGFSDIQRTEFWNKQKKLVGMKVEVRADSISQNQDGTYSLRFPRFKCFRGFKKGEKI